MAAGGAGAGVPVLPLPGRVHARGHRSQVGPQGVSHLSLVSEQVGSSQHLDVEDDIL